jgi:outer membrane protein assembly factor BamE (lipoprotein component of BamABCDE complex)
MRFPLAVLGLALSLAACQPTVEHRGYLAKPGVFDQIKEGMAKSEVEATLGSPSTTASINFEGDSYYYISSVTSQSSFLSPEEVKREVIAIRFGQTDQVTSFAQYGLEDGKVIDVNTRKTPTRGRELSLISQLLGNVGKGNPFGF